MSEKSSENLDQSLSALMDNEASEFEFRRLLKALGGESESSRELCQKWRRYNLTAFFMRKESSLNLDVDIASAVSEAIELEDTYRFEPHSFAEQPPLSESTVNKQDNIGPEVQSLNAGSPKKSSAKTWKDMLVQTSVAASVAVACVFGAQHLDLTNVGQQEVAENDSGPQTNDSLASSHSTFIEAPYGFDLPVARASAVAAVTEQQSYTQEPARRMQGSMSDIERRASEHLLQLHFEHLMRQHAEAQAENGNWGVLPYARIPVDSSRK